MFSCIRTQYVDLLWSVFSCIRTRKISVFGHFSRSVYDRDLRHERVKLMRIMGKDKILSRVSLRKDNTFLKVLLFKPEIAWSSSRYKLKTGNTCWT